MYSQGLIKNDPHSMQTEDQHVAELAGVLSSTYGLNAGKIKGTLKLSYPERRRVADTIERVHMIKMEKEREKEAMEHERDALRETLDKIAETEEEEVRKKKNKKRRSAEISQMAEEFQEEQANLPDESMGEAFKKHLKKLLPKRQRGRHRTTIAREIQKEVEKKVRKRGPAKWLTDDPTVLSQIDDQTAAKAETAHHLDVKEIVKKGLSEEEKVKQIKTIAEQMRDQYASIRDTEEKMEMERQRQQRKREEASKSDTAEAAVEKYGLMKDQFPLTQTPMPQSSLTESKGEEDKGKDAE